MQKLSGGLEEADLLSYVHQKARCSNWPHWPPSMVVWIAGCRFQFQQIGSGMCLEARIMWLPLLQCRRVWRTLGSASPRGLMLFVEAAAPPLIKKDLHDVMSGHVSCSLDPLKYVALQQTSCGRCGVIP